MVFYVSKLSMWQELEAESFEEARKKAADMAGDARAVQIGILDNTQNVVKLAEEVHIVYEGDSDWHQRPH